MRANWGNASSRSARFGRISPSPLRSTPSRWPDGGRQAVLVGESKWARIEDAGRLCRVLARKAQALPSRATDLRYAVCAGDRLTNIPDDAVAVTAGDIFA